MVHDPQETVTMICPSFQCSNYMAKCRNCGRLIHAASFPVRIRKWKEGDTGHFVYCRHCKIKYTVIVG
jgi:predicted SprT family Zn-dependent metalloprotease